MIEKTNYLLWHMYGQPDIVISWVLRYEVFQDWKLPIKNHRPWHLANLCAGNHELGFDPSVSSDHWALGSRSGHLGNSPMCGQVDSLKEDMDNLSTSEKQKSTLPNNIRSELTNCIYLEDSAVEICGLKVYGRLRLVL